MTEQPPDNAWCLICTYGWSKESANTSMGESCLKSHPREVCTIRFIEKLEFRSGKVVDVIAQSLCKCTFLDLLSLVLRLPNEHSNNQHWNQWRFPQKPTHKASCKTLREAESPIPGPLRKAFCCWWPRNHSRAEAPCQWAEEPHTTLPSQYIALDIFGGQRSTGALSQFAGREWYGPTPRSVC